MRSSSSHGFGNGNKKPTSALSKIGKHAPPPISPIISLKSTNSSVSDFNYVNKGSSKSSNLSTTGISTTSSESSSPALSSSNTCAWRIKKSVDLVPEPVNVPMTKYPQRKVPALTPEPVVREEIEKKKEEPKNFFDRHEEFPGLQGKKPAGLNTKGPIDSNTATAKISTAPSESSGLAPIPTISVPMPPLPSKLVSGDFNFLEDDDWLDGDSIDYSQNLFQDNEHFLPIPSLPHPHPLPPPTTEPHVVVKAKSLLAERCHSSKKKDIWKPVPEESKTKIKILKRPEVVEVSETVNLMEKLEVKNSEVNAKKVEIKKVEVKKEVKTEVKKEVKTEVKKEVKTQVKKEVKKVEAKKEVKTAEAKKEVKISLPSDDTKTEPKAEVKKKFVYSSASKTLQMK